ncbi:hypothetical protein E4U43_003833 [Claviceps pusilla]|uniref:Uncharacterized protein n=1 Tax=Claviceps pusilla TaxID=123648 RepID=A0A9P7N6M5_9HYPO|nr:hypothetical protein E4U43_003833 [Claviceps pusilla]
MSTLSSLLSSVTNRSPGAPAQALALLEDIEPYRSMAWDRARLHSPPDGQFHYRQVCLDHFIPWNPVPWQSVAEGLARC